MFQINSKVMVILSTGKAKLRKTGEVVYVVGHNGENDKRRKTDWVSYIDANMVEHQMEKGLNLAWDFEEVDKYNYEEREELRAFKTHLCYFSGMAMQTLIHKKDIETLNTDESIDFLTGLSVEYGKALCAKLDKIDIVELMKEHESDKKADGQSEEVAVGQIVEIKGSKYLCVEKKDSDCPDCDLDSDFQNDGVCPLKGFCTSEYRKDKKDVVFKKQQCYDKERITG